MDKQQLKKAAIYLKCGEYDGTHIMTGWIACNELIKAQDRIAELEAELKAREWVSVEDELPAGGDIIDVLTIEEERIPEAQFTDETFFLLEQQWDVDDDGYGCTDYTMKLEGVTHWMPLPSPPESDNG